MRRQEKEVCDQKELENIILSSPYMVLGLTEPLGAQNNPATPSGETAPPYLVPLDFGYQDRCVYFHCARQGKKLDLLAQNSNVFLLFVNYDGLINRNKNGTACNFSTKYSSVMATGQAQILTDEELREEALHIILQRYKLEHLPINPASMAATCLVQVKITDLSGKQNL